jgi:chromosome segregation protein
VTEQINHAELSLQSFQERRLELEKSTMELEQGVSEVKTNLENLSKLATESQVRAAAKEQLVEGLKNQKSKIEASIHEVQAQLSRMQDDSTKNSGLIEELIKRQQENKIELDGALQKIKVAEDELKKAKDSFEVQSQVVREKEAKATELQQAKNQSQKDMGEAQIKQSQAELNLQYLVDQINERYMLQMKDVLEQYQNRATDEQSLIQAQLELDDFREKIKKIGEVNLTAIQEYEELSKRFEFLTTQQQDLLGAMESLRKVIDRINRICHRRFRDTFEAVNERFKKVFPVLFGGGEAQLILVENPEHAGDPGVEIMARPPGKKLQSVTLLSGGEKALTAVSLIFSIFLFKPSPFCLLDEVDAPLDDANVYRFNDLVREMSKRSQVILVTHNKHTMEINNTLYGVTMEDPGVSKMVAVKLDR